MKQFILEEQLEFICDKDREHEEVVELEKEELMQVMLRLLGLISQYLRAICGGFHVLGPCSAECLSASRKSDREFFSGIKLEVFRVFVCIRGCYGRDKT